MPLPFFNGRYQIFSAPAGGTEDYQPNGLFFDETSNFTATDVQVGDFIVDVNGFLYEIAVINTSSPLNVDVIDTESNGAPANGAAVVTRRTVNNQLYVPTRISNGITEFLKEHVRNITLSNTDNIGGGNQTIQGQSGFASHYIDNSGNNDVNSYIEFDDADSVHYHKVEPQVDANYIDIRIGFQFPSNFKGLDDTTNAFEFYAKTDNGSGDAVNLVSLTNLIAPDGTPYAVTGKETSATSRTQITLTKAEVDTILNPVASSSSSASNNEWGELDAGTVIFAEFRMFGNLGDNIYLDHDDAFMYILI